MAANNIGVLLAVAEHLLECSVCLDGTRLLDHLNDPRSDFLRITNVRVRCETGERSIGTLKDSVVPKSSIRFAIPISDKHEAPEKRYNAFATKQKCPVVVLIRGFELKAQLHHKGSGDAAHFLAHESDHFLPLTEATVTCQGAGMDIPTSPVVLVNKQFVELISTEQTTAPSDELPAEISQMLREIVNS